MGGLALAMILASTSVSDARAAAAPDAAEAPMIGLRQAHWVDVDRRSRNLYRAGLITGLAGVGVEIVGLAVQSPVVQIVGDLGQLTGAPLMAAGAVRSSRALREFQVPISRTLGFVSWGLWGGAIAIGLFAPINTTALTIFDIGSFGLLVGSYVTAGLQQRVNNQVRRQVGLKAHRESRKGVQFAVAPWMSRRSPGLQLVIAAG